jgi:hypothetical protein
MRWLFLSAVLVLLQTPAALAQDFCKGCGCKGGPGYRGPDGGCVGWAQLNKVCGTPPTTKCMPEGPALIALGIAAAKNALTPATNAQHAAALADEEAVPGVAITSSELKAKADGVVCVAVETLRAMQTCPKQSPPVDCGQQEKTLVDAGACVRVARDAVVSVQAGSRSFDWLRIKLKDRGVFWAERGLFLAR